MKFSLILSTLAGLALAQSSASVTASTSVVVGSATSTGNHPSTTTNPIVACLNACPAGDVNCQAICVGVPHPGSAQTNATTDCVAKCDQGDGSTSASLAYAKCRDACISSYIITAPGNTFAPGGEYTTPAIPGVPTTVVTKTSSGAVAASGASTSPAGTSTAATATQTRNAANTVQIGAAGGLVGVALAAFAWL